MSSVAYAPDIAQAPSYGSPPDPFDRIATQYSKIIDQNHETFEAEGFTPKFMWVLAATMGFYLMSKNRMIFASVETIAARAKVSERTVKRALAFMKTIELLTMTPKGILGKRGGRADSEYRFNESHSLWKTLCIPVKKPVQKETSKCQAGTLNPAPYIYREKPVPVTVPITRYSGSELRKKPIETPEPPKAAHPVYPEDSEILGETLRYWGIADFAVKTCAAILGELPPEYGGAPPLLREILHGRPPWHNWRRIESPAAYIRQIAKNEATRWNYTT